MESLADIRAGGQTAATSDRMRGDAAVSIRRAPAQLRTACVPWRVPQRLLPAVSGRRCAPRVDVRLLPHRKPSSSPRGRSRRRRRPCTRRRRRNGGIRPATPPAPAAAVIIAVAAGRTALFPRCVCVCARHQRWCGRACCAQGHRRGGARPVAPGRSRGAGHLWS